MPKTEIFEALTSGFVDRDIPSDFEATIAAVVLRGAQDPTRIFLDPEQHLSDSEPVKVKEFPLSRSFSMWTKISAESAGHAHEIAISRFDEVLGFLNVLIECQGERNKSHLQVEQPKSVYLVMPIRPKNDKAALSDRERDILLTAETGLCGLGKSEPWVRLAARWYAKSASTENSVDAFISAWIGFEALVKQGRNMTFMSAALQALEEIYPEKRGELEPLLRPIYKKQRNPLFHAGEMGNQLDTAILRAMLADLIEHSLLKSNQGRTEAFF
jgi:hypothetical protein